MLMEWKLHIRMHMSSESMHNSGAMCARDRRCVTKICATQGALGTKPDLVMGNCDTFYYTFFFSENHPKTVVV